MRNLAGYLGTRPDPSKPSETICLLNAVGLEKSGTFVEHAVQIADRLKPETVLVLSNDYIHRYITPGDSDTADRYGNNTRSFGYGTRMTSTVLVPSYSDLLWPTLRAVRALGDSGTIEEIDEQVVEEEAFTEDLQAIQHGEGPRTEIEYRLAWARTYLKRMGALENSERGVWSTTERGRTMTPEDVEERHAEYKAHLYEARKAKRQAAADPGDIEEDESVLSSWKERLLETLLEVPADGFERLARRLLLEAGFVSATVTGRSGDGGIDGIGVYRLSLVSFPVFFQCKRYKGSVGSGAVRDFRGAMTGRGDKGLLITTGTFTGDAKQEATRDGAPPIDLIDGERLCDLLREHRLGVKTIVRQVEDIEIAQEFFADL